MRAYVSLLVLLVARTTILNARPSNETRHTPIVFTRVAVIDTANGSIQPDMTVVVSGNRIAQVGKAADVKVPKGAQAVDSRGKFLMPGLIDMHTHLGDNEDTEVLPLNLFLANGVTTIRDPGDSVLVMRLIQEEIISGKRTGPRLFFCGDVLDGLPPLYRSSTLLVDSPERARSAVMFLADQGVNCIKVYNSVKEPELKEIIRTAHERDLPVIGHIPRTLTMTRAVELGMLGLEHIRVTGREMLPIEEANKIDFLPFAERETKLWGQFNLQSEKMKRLVNLLAESKVFLDPTLVKDEYIFALSIKDEIDDENNRYLPPQLFEKWKAEPIPEFNTLLADLKQAGVDGFRKRQRFVGMCSRAGVRIIAGTDGVYFSTALLPGFGLQRELQLLVQSGLTPLQAIQAATVNAAEALAREHDLGAVEPGYFADLVLLDANPLEDIRNTQKIRAEVVNGRYLDRAALDELLTQAKAGAK